MSINLEGGCFVSGMWAQSPAVAGTLSRWDIIGPQNGAKAISLSILEYGTGLSHWLSAVASDHILYRLETTESADSNCKVFIDSWEYEVGPQTGVYVPCGKSIAVDNERSEPAIFISSRSPNSDLTIVDRVSDAHDAQGERPRQTVRLADRPPHSTADRWYRVLVDDELGSTQATQFVGSIPPGRAPDHFHTYEEVLFILRGEGRMWAGQTNTPIGRGSCVYLPKGQRHCVENTGTDELRVLGVFYPAGSPAVRYE